MEKKIQERLISQTSKKWGLLRIWALNNTKDKKRSSKRHQQKNKLLTLDLSLKCW